MFKSTAALNAWYIYFTLPKFSKKSSTQLRLYGTAVVSSSILHSAFPFCDALTVWPLSLAWYYIAMQQFLVRYHRISLVSCIFLVFTLAWFVKTVKLTRGIFHGINLESVA